MLMAGAGIRRGLVYGATDKHAAFVERDPVTPADLTATIFTLLGVDPRAVVRDRKGQTRPISRGRAVRSLFA
jgi:hypothetical protein